MQDNRLHLALYGLDNEEGSFLESLRLDFDLSLCRSIEELQTVCATGQANAILLTQNQEHLLTELQKSENALIIQDMPICALNSKSLCKTVGSFNFVGQWGNSKLYSENFKKIATFLFTKKAPESVPDVQFA